MVYNIQKICPHEGFHLDEAGAAGLARIYGKNRFVGIENALVEPSALTGTEDENLMAGRLPLGQLCGRFDDKDPVTHERRKDTCCATRMAEFLGVSDRPALRVFLRALTRVDSTATASATDLSCMIKNAIESFPKEIHSTIFAWAAQAVEAIIAYLEKEEEVKLVGQELSCTDYVKPTTVLEGLIADNCIEDERIVERLRKMVKGCETQLHNCIDVSFIMRAFKVKGVDDAVAYDWLYTGLQKCAEQQVLYYLAVTEIEEKGKVFAVDPRFRGDDVRAVFIESGNMQVAKASRNPRFGYDICIVRRPSKNVAIIPNAHARLDMSVVWALIRILETPADRRRGASFEAYKQPGNHKMAPHWHMMESGSALNGTNFISASPTVLPDAVIMNIIRIGFAPLGKRRFYELNGVFKEGGANAKPINTRLIPTEPVTGPGWLDYRSRSELEHAFDQARPS